MLTRLLSIAKLSDVNLKSLIRYCNSNLLRISFSNSISKPHFFNVQKHEIRKKFIEALQEHFKDLALTYSIGIVFLDNPFMYIILYAKKLQNFSRRANFI